MQPQPTQARRARRRLRDAPRKSALARPDPRKRGSGRRMRSLAGQERRTWMVARVGSAA